MTLGYLKSRCERAWVDTLRDTYVPPRCALDMDMVQSSLMVIGEAPGAEEEEYGEPFVGKAGKILKEGCDEVGLPWKVAHITNVVKYRPMTDTGLGNRAPSMLELDQFRDILYEEIEEVNPRVILCLGASAVKGLKKNPPAISSLVGKTVGFKISLSTVFVTFAWHPSYVNYNGGKGGRVYQEFIQQLEHCNELYKAHRR